ncbi:MAG: DUF4118 domain-containing protein [Clostridiales bacterium]|nr:DUF4118 domain-containing protein [Clostridiales bacterium]
MKIYLQRQFKNALLTIGFLLAAMMICLWLRNIFDTSANAQMVFLLAVLLVARFADGYFWGIFASFCAVPLVNYMFTYPYFAFNLTISGYLLTFVTMLAVSLIVSVLTTRIKQQERLRVEAEKETLRANLLRAVSHDLRTPLTSIVGATGAILDNDLPQEKQRELLEDVKTDAQWLLRMIENLLAITRIRGGDVPLNLETQVIEDVLAEAIIKFQKHFKDINVQMNLSDDILLADMDAVLVEQVVLNLLENAVYHGHCTTKIILSSKLEGGDVVITVSDNGEGIRKDVFPQLFKTTLQSGMASNADNQKHMGIGLSVCKSIINAHGGSMSAKNNECGGADFSFTLPEKENDYGNQDIDR